MYRKNLDTVILNVIYENSNIYNMKIATSLLLIIIA